LLRDGLPGMGVLAKRASCVTARKGVIRLLKGLCSREGKVWDIFVFVISISRWNQIHIESVPWNNEQIVVHLEDKWRRIIVLHIDANLTLQWILDFLGRR